MLEMSNETQIEKQGISYLKTFLLESGKLDPKIAEDDKYPIWDGDIFVYRSNYWKNDNIRGRVPIQVKSRRGQFNKHEKYKISKIELQQFLEDGGCFYLRPVFQDNHQYRIYYKILLTIDIINLLREFGDGAKTKLVRFDHCDDIKKMEALLIHFLENRNSQISFNKDEYLKYMDGSEIKITVKTISNSNNILDILNENSYVYINSGHKALIPTDLKLSSLSAKRNIDIICNGKIYFEGFSIRHSSGSTTELILNSALKFQIFGNELKFNHEASDNTYISDIIKSMNFIVDVHKCGYFEIDGHRIEGNLDKIELPDVNYLRQLERYLKFLESIKIDSDKITMQQLKNEEEVLILLLSIFENEEQYSITPSKDDIIFKTYRLFNKTILVFFQRVVDDKYRGQNFMSSSIFDIAMTVNDKGYRVSQYVALQYIYGENLPNNIDILLGYYDLVIDDICKKYDPEIEEYYNQFVLGLISGFDICKEDRILTLAVDILKFLLTYENCNTDVLNLNLYQIRYRNQSLTQDDKKEIFKIRKRHQDEAMYQCCCHLLLNESDSFELSFEELNDREKDVFKSYPIYKLFELK